MVAPTRALGRDSAVDCIKTFAIWGVLLIHISAGGFGGAVGSFDWGSALFWGSVSRASVPLFFMCTGALLLRPEKEYPLRRILTHNLPRLVCALLFWAALYALYHLLATGLTAAALMQAAKDLVLFRHESHLYYLHIAILIYLCVPLLRVFTAHATRRQMEYALLLWFLLGIVFPTVRPFWPFSLLRGIPQQYALNMTWASLGYCLLGFYLRTNPPHRRWLCPALWALGLGLVFGGTWIASTRAGTLDARFLEGMSIGVAIMACGIFGTLGALRPGARVQKAARTISASSFAVYLSHMFFLYGLRSLGLSAAVQPTLLVIPAIAVLTFAGSFVLWLVLRHIPLVRTWLI